METAVEQNAATKQVDIPINPGRVLYGLSRIGYTPASAICDIIDNAVMAHATNVYVLIAKENERFNDSRRGNVREYLIIDDGDGMPEEIILKALELGSTQEYYEEATLSKFGLGLKSASFSQGDELEVISGQAGSFNKYMVSLPMVQAESRYFATKQDLTESDNQYIEQYLTEGKGTIIKIGKVRKEGHPSIKHTVDELKKRAGVIYYYFLKDEDTKIYIDSIALEPIDILFSEEAEGNGNLDENTWNGREVRWIEKPKDIMVDSDYGVNATIEVTQLPHPPTYRHDAERGSEDNINKKYLIEGLNYGFYVYRNKRLISWADRFISAGGKTNIIPLSQDLYSFRGRILISDSADDVFNIDVKKSNITLSDEAWNTLSDQSLEYKRKSIKAWNRAKSLLKEKDIEETNQQSNLIIDELEIPDTLPGTEPVSDEIVDEVEKESEEISKQRLEKIRKQVEEDLKSNPESANIDVNSAEAPAQIETTALKGDVNPYATKIFRVPYTEDNVLWEPYYDTDNGHCVRINKVHRFSKVLFEDNQENPDMQILFELFLHQLAVSEVESLKHLAGSFKNIDIKTLQKILSEYRRMTSEYIANMCRKLEDKLPPISK